MKKIFYLFSVAFMALAIGCTEDEIIKQEPTFPVDENEVPFGAGEGAFNTGEKSSKGGASRTIYEIAPNSKFETYTELIVSWKEQDPIRVYSPEAPDGYRTADYTVTPQLDSGEGIYGKGGYLMKVGENGIHWGNGTTQRFFAFYPGDDKHLPDLTNNLKTSGVFTHTIPVAQEKGVEVSYDIDTGKLQPDLKGAWKIISPDMTFCNMVAEATCDPSQGDMVKLQFYPLVTVLDVVVTGGDDTYDILGVSIKSKTQDIVGTYTFDFEKEKGSRITFLDSQDEANKTAYIDCMHDQTPLKLSKGQYLNLKFFLLPRDINANELSIEVLCEGGYVLRKSLNKDVILQAGKVIKIRTPKISFSNKTNNWMSMIDDNVYFASQLSLPGAKHAYSYTTLDASGKVYPEGGQNGMGDTQIPTIDPNYNRNKGIMPFYQTMSIKEMFNSGVRAFDIKVITDSGTAYIFAAGKETKTTLVEFLNTLKTLIGGDTQTATEGVVVNINFAYAKNPSQDAWVQTIKKALQDYDNDGSTLCKVTSETTMKEMRGHIGIMLHYDGDKTYAPKYIGILKGFSTSVQNTENTTLQLGATGKLHLQNLYQVNNPEITDNTIDGVRANVGLCPHFILHENVKNGTPVNLIAKKQELAKQLLDESQKENGALTELFLNDLSGFCVVNDNGSTGWRHYAKFTWTDRVFGSDYWKASNIKKDVRDPSKHGIELIQDPPTNPKYGESYVGEYDGGSPEKGQGGNTALFAQEINTYAQEAIYDVVERGRAPLGIVYMNFAGVRTLQVGGETYQVNGINLPSMIMSNNFKFALKKKESTSAK